MVRVLTLEDQEPKNYVPCSSVSSNITGGKYRTTDILTVMEIIVSTQRQLCKCSILSGNVASNSTNKRHCTQQNKQTIASWLFCLLYVPSMGNHSMLRLSAKVIRTVLCARSSEMAIHRVKCRQPLAVPSPVLSAQSVQINSTSFQYVFIY